MLAETVLCIMSSSTSFFVALSAFSLPFIQACVSIWLLVRCSSLDVASLMTIIIIFDYVLNHFTAARESMLLIILSMFPMASSSTISVITKIYTVYKYTVASTHAYSD